MGSGVRHATRPGPRAAGSPPPGRPTRWRTDTIRPRLVAIALGVVLLTVASLGLLVWQRLNGPAVAAGDRATLDGLTTEVHTAGWVELGHVHDGQGGFLMPDQMMPGAPTGGEVRLGIDVTLSNTASGTRGFNLVEEFTLVGGTTGEPEALSADSIGSLSRLASGAAVRGTLYFDLMVPAEGSPPLYLQWNRDGETVRIAVPLDADAPGHDHG
jgi:hypothetical protein